MLSFTIAGESVKSEAARVSICLGDAPRVSLAAHERSTVDLQKLAASFPRGTVSLGNGINLPFEVAGVSDAPLGGSGIPNQSWVHGRLAPVDLLNWLDAPTLDASADETLVLQRGMGGSITHFLQAAIGDDWLLSDGSETALNGIAPGACLLRPGWMTNRTFIDVLVRQVAWRDPRLLGWRLVPAQRGGVVLAVGAEQPLPLKDADWKVDARFAMGTPLHIRADGDAATLYALEDIAATLFSEVLPKAKLLSPSAVIPPTPRLVTVFGRTWLAAETTLLITRDRLSEVRLTVIDPPPPRPPDCESRTMLATVSGWASDNAALALMPAGDVRWRVLTGDPKLPRGALRANFLTPALFAQGRGGIYLRPLVNDPRAVQITSGEVPFSPGVPMTRDKDAEDAGTDIALSGNGIALSAANATKLALTNECAKVDSQDIDISGSVAVSGKLDVS
jgi:hypothetical protein